MYEYSSYYIFIGDCFNRTTMTIEYQGEEDKFLSAISVSFPSLN